MWWIGLSCVGRCGAKVEAPSWQSPLLIRIISVRCPSVMKMWQCDNCDLMSPWQKRWEKLSCIHNILQCKPLACQLLFTLNIKESCTPTLSNCTLGFFYSQLLCQVYDLLPVCVRMCECWCQWKTDWHCRHGKQWEHWPSLCHYISHTR